MPIPLDIHTMGLFTWMGWKKPERRAYEQQLPLHEIGWNTYKVGNTDTGINITEESVLETSTGLSCIEFIGGILASVAQSGKTYKKTTEGRELVEDHSTTKLVRNPHEELYTSVAFWQVVATNLCTHGNHFSLIGRNGSRPTLTVLNPKQVKFELNGGHPFYIYKQKPIAPSEMFHIAGMTTDGFMGVSPVLKNKRTFELALAAEMYGARYFGNGNHSDGYLTMQGSFGTDEALEQFKEQMDKSRGLEEAGKTPFYMHGIEWKPKGYSNHDSQFLEARQYQARSICQIYRVRPYMVGLETSSKSPEAESLDFEKYTLRPWVDKVEAEIDRKLFTEEEKASGYFHRFNVDSLLRADVKTRYEANKIANGGMPWETVNEQRTRENLPKWGPEFDQPIMPMNMAQASDQLGTDDQPEPPVDEQPPEEILNPNTPKSTFEEKAFAPVLADGIRRILTKEINAIKRAMKKHTGDEFNSWADEFYNDHQSHVAEVMKPSLTVLVGEENASAVLDRFAITHCEESKRALQNAVGSVEKLEGILQEWMESRAKQITQALLENNGTRD